MRLIDKVVNAPRSEDLVDETGHPVRVAGVGAKADSVRDCTLRYILDPAVSAECLTFVLNESNGLLEPGNPLLRLPTETFWMEWYGMQSFVPRGGILVETAPGGRSGLLSGYFEDEQGRADKVGVCIEFDLDRPWNSRGGSGLALRHGLYAHLNDLLGCAIVHLDREWERFFRARAPLEYRRSLEDIGEHCWYLLPMVCAFAAMLNSPDVLVESRSDLERLNAARIRRGRHPLLDHIEVSIRLGEARDGSRGRSGSNEKKSPRLHHVRGHFVHRYGKTFWRAAHLRGDADRPIIRKTVNVHGSFRPSQVRPPALRQRG